MADIYEQIINRFFEDKLSHYDRKEYYIGEKVIGQDEAVLYLSRYLYQYIQNLIVSFVNDADGVERGVELVNTIIKKLGSQFNIADYHNNLIDARKSILTSIVNKAECNYADVAGYVQSITPITSLTQSSLFTGKNSSVNMCSELKKEILSSDRIDILVSFIKMSGINLLMQELKEFTDSGKPLRIITTTYMGATEFKAIARLATLQHTDIKISYNGSVDRLHAKAYIFYRNSGFHTAYVGSSNISFSALTDGLEWNLKATQVELPHVLNSVKNTFDTYWADASFESFCLGRDDERLQLALTGVGAVSDTLDYSCLELMRAKEYQKEVLDSLSVERDFYHHFHNLVVAATGTGKTVIAAFDYKRFKESHERANFLFVVHREEIIKQACATFRMVLGDANFGDMWYGGHETSNYQYLFASKDILNNRLDDLQLSDDYYDYIIIDEAHHIVAPTYQKILKKFKPRILLGLTATPERMDEKDITSYFDDKISAEIRLDTALNNGLLAPFHYYGITDSVDLSEVKWERGRFVASELSKVYTANDARTQIVFKALEKYIPNYNDVRALCFCVDKQHAEYMSAKFTLAGLKSAVLTSDYTYNRNRELKRLKKKEINYLFVVDMFNEGVDIPLIDTVLFLRPTESVTVYLQQFGRGLRKAEGKEALTVLDFVGQSRAEFNYTDRLRALMGRTSMSVKEEVERDFPHLPLGCSITLERKAKEYILNNIAAFINRYRTSNLLSLLKNFDRDFGVPLTLPNFVRLTHAPLAMIYKGRTWSDWLNLVGQSTLSSRFSEELSRAVRKKWLSTDSFSYFSFLEELALKGFKVNVDLLSHKERCMALMFYYDLYDQAGDFTSLQAMFNALSADRCFVSEVGAVVSLLKGGCKALEMADNSQLALFMPLQLHAEYTKAQIQVALQTSTIQKKSSSREGVERSVIHGKRVEAMYVDIIKDREIGANTNYDDFAISADLFNWETQNQVSQTTKAGQNYIEQNQIMLLFVRKQAKAADDKSRTNGYIYLGEVTLVSYEGNNPMKIVWKLKTPMPASVTEYACKYAAVG